MFHFSRKAFNTHFWQSASFKIQYWKQIVYLYAVVPRTYEYQSLSPITLILMNLGSPFVASIVPSSSVFCIPSFFSPYGPHCQGGNLSGLKLMVHDKWVFPFSLSDNSFSGQAGRGRNCLAQND